MVNYGFPLEKFNEYVIKFADLNEIDEISNEYKNILLEYKDNEQLHANLLAMMLNFAIVFGRSDTVDFLLDLGADPNNFDSNNYIHELLVENEINENIIKHMENSFESHGFKVNLFDCQKPLIYDG
jgi:hypothetical protein